MMRHPQVCILITIVAALCTSCGGGGGSADVGNSLAIRFTTPTSSPIIDQGQTVTITAEVVNDSSNAGVSWTVGPPAPHGATIGTLSDISATTVTYNAPAAVFQQTPVTVTATSKHDNTVTAVIGIMIQPAPIIITTSPDLHVGAVGVSYESKALIDDSGINLIQLSGGVAPYTWTVSSGLLPDGLSLASAEPGVTTIPGEPVTTSFKCSNVPCIKVTGKPTTSQISTFSVQAKDSAGLSTTVPLTIAVRPKTLQIQMPILAIPTVNKPYPVTALTVANGIPPFTWSVFTGALADGLSMNSDGVISGTPTLFQTFNTTIQVADGQSPVAGVGRSAFDFSTLQLNDSCGSGDEAKLSSSAPYAFLLKGFDADGPVVIAGNFTVDGAGNITGGVEDINRTSGAQTNVVINSAGSSYSISTNRGCLTLANAAGTTTKFRFSLGGLQGSTFTRGRVIEFDDDNGTATRASGVLRLQDPASFNTSAISGLYAFGLSGWNSTGGRFAMAGSGSASNGTLSSIAADINNEGAVLSALNGGAGNYSISPNGRGTGSFTVGSSTFAIALYPLSNSEVLIVTTAPRDATHPLASGEEVSTVGPFNSASLKDNHIFHTTGFSSSGPDVSVGILSFDSNGKFAGTKFQDNAGTQVLDPNTGSFALLTSGDYTVDTASGRVALSGATAGSNPPVLYAVPATSGVTGFIVGTDSSASSGRMEYQVANSPLFNLTSIAGTYVFGTAEPGDSQSSNLEGNSQTQALDGGTTGVWDLSLPIANGLIPNQGFATKASVRIDGSGVYGGNNAFVTNGASLFYIDESPTNPHPSITVLEK